MQLLTLRRRSVRLAFGIVSFITVAGFLGSGHIAFAHVAEADVSGGPSREEINARAAEGQPSDEQIKQFQKEFGGPPESFPEPTIQKPEFEQPGSIPEEVKKYVSDKDLVAVYCAMTKWKTGQFFLAMDAVKQYVIEPSRQIKSDFGVEFSIPDVDGLIADGNGRVEKICGSATVAEAEKSAADFANWGQHQNQSAFDGMRSEMQEKLTAKGNELQAKVKTQIQPFIEEQKSGIEAEMKTLAARIVEQKKSEVIARLKGSKTPPNIAAIKEEITQAVTAAIQAKVEERKAAMQGRITAKVQELIGPEIAKFKKIGDTFQNVGQKITDYIKANESKYDVYKKQAFALRKKLVFDILDKNLAEGMAKLDAAAGDLAEAKKNDPSVKSADELKAALKEDRKDLESKLDAALENGDERAFQEVLNGFRVKWEAVQREGEKSMQQSVAKVCTIALAQFDKASAQMEPGTKKIKDLQTKCSGSVTDECLGVSKFSSRFETILSKFTDLKTEMSLATAMCKNPETANRKNMVALMKKIQSDAEDVKVYGGALEADKTKVLSETASTICKQALPQLVAAQNEIQKNDLASLENNIARCKGKATEECAVVNKFAGDVAGLKAKIAAFNGNVEKARNLCAKTGDEENLKSLGDTLNMLRSDGDSLRKAATDLQAKQSEKMSAKILCRSVVPQLENGKQEIAGGLAQMNALLLGCGGKNDVRCAVINANSSKFDALKAQTKATLGKIADIRGRCESASADTLNQGLIEALNGVKGDKETIEKMVTELKALEAEAGKSAGITIEAESETGTSLLPRTESWHSIKGKSGESWRPPVFGSGYWYLSRGGESLTYNFTAKKEGPYHLWVRDYVDNFQPKGVRRITISFDGKSFGTFPETTTSVPSGNKIGVFAWHKVGGTVSLKAGAHTMKVVKESTTLGAAILDAFYLTAGSEVPPEK